MLACKDSDGFLLHFLTVLQKHHGFIAAFIFNRKERCMPQKENKNDTVADKQSEWQRRAGPGRPMQALRVDTAEGQHSGPGSRANPGSSALSGPVLTQNECLGIDNL